MRDQVPPGSKNKGIIGDTEEKNACVDHPRLVKSFISGHKVKVRPGDEESKCFAEAVLKYHYPGLAGQHSWRYLIG
ncbi:MAG: hypothetical protein JXD19_05895 [Deltaproteobacteria bacterium]|nr:hypothetical protein [Deltaproteobacteria bacterium]